MAGVADMVDKIENKVQTAAEASGAITNVQNEDNTQKQNMEVVEEHENWLDTVKDEYDQGLIDDASIRAACARQNPPVDPTSILEYMHMSNLDRQQSPYFKTDLRDTQTKGYEYNGTLGDGESVTVAGCTITATKYEGEDVYDTDDVFGMEQYKVKKVYDALMDRGTMDYIGEMFGGTKTDNFDDLEDYAPSERTLYHCHSDYLGDFDYDPTIFRIGYKEIEEKDGTISQLPVLEYCGPTSLDNVWVCGLDDNTSYEWFASHANEPAIDDCEDVVDNLIPKGCKNLDYTFCTVNGRFLNFLPRVPEGVTSMNYTFAGSEMDVFPDMNYSQKMSLADSSGKNYLLPSTVECLQGTFQDCDNFHPFHIYMRNPEYTKTQEDSLKQWFAGGHYTSETDDTEAYLDQLPKEVVNSVDMCAGCDGMDKEFVDGYLDDSVWFLKIDHRSYITHEKVKYGGELTPYLTEEMSRGMYDDIADASAMIHGADAKEGYFKDRGDIDFLIEKDGSLDAKFDTSGLDQEKLNMARSNQMIEQEGKVDSGYVDTSVEVSKDGWITNNKVKEEDGSMTYDATGLKVSYQDYMHDTSAAWEKWAQAGAIGLVAGLVAGNASDNKWLGIAAGVGGGFLASK